MKKGKAYLLLNPIGIAFLVAGIVAARKNSPLWVPFFIISGLCNGYVTWRFYIESFRKKKG